MIDSRIGTDDVIATVISNSVNTIIIYLTTISFDAIWSSFSLDLGSDVVVDCYKQINPKIIFANNGYIYRGKLIKLEKYILEWS